MTTHLNSPTQLKYFIPATIWLAFILFATLSSVSTLEHFNWHDIFSYDKPIHMFLFGTQVYLIVYGFRKNTGISRKLLLWISIYTSVFGAFVEYLQILITTTRSFDYFDMIANALGCCIAYFWLDHKINKGNYKERA